MPFALTLKPSYLSDVVRLPRTVAKRLEKVCLELQKDPVRTGGNIKKLVGYENLYRYRIDDHRLIYAVQLEPPCVQLLATGPRRDVYERFKGAAEIPVHAVPADISPAEKGADASEASDVTLVGPIVEPPPPAEGPPAFTAERLPKFGEKELLQWLVPAEFHPDLLHCTTDEDLLQANVPGIWKDRVIDCLFPKSIAQVQTQPSLVVDRVEDVTRYAEGSLLGFLLLLDPEQEALARRSLKGPALIKGGPGSGKSTVAMYRAKALVERSGIDDRTPSVLFTTYTNALVSVSEQLLGQLLGSLPHELKVATVDSIAVGIVRSCDGQPPEFATAETCRAVLAEVRAQAPQAAAPTNLDAFLADAVVRELPLDYLLDEFQWCIEGRGARTEKEYLDLDRTGRGVKLTPATRRRVWALYEGYRQELERRGSTTWGAVRLRAHELVLKGAYDRRYDFVIVDEAQDLTPVAIRLCIELCRSPEGLFLTADAGQSIYNRGFSWNSIHDSLQLRGRTRLLKRNYRTTLQLSRAVADILRNGGTSDTETVVQDAVREGQQPIVKACKDRHSQFQWLAARIRETALQLKVSQGCTGILCPTRAIARETADTLRRVGLEASFQEGRNLRLDGNDVKVLTMHSAKGLEFPIVALPGLEEGVFPWPADAKGDVRGDEDEQRRVFYVAASRAMRRLFISTSIGRVSSFLRGLSSEHWDLRLGAEETA